VSGETTTPRREKYLPFGKEAVLSDRGTVGRDADMPIPAKRPTCAFGGDLPNGGCGNPGVAEFGCVLLCERHFEEAEARERIEHWEEVDLCLDMWLKIAHVRSNATLSRLLRYAQLEAKAEREYGRKALERAVKAGR
jgi:hypothetical protein